MSDRLKIAAATKNFIFAPLNKLKKSPKNDGARVPWGAPFNEINKLARAICERVV